MKVEISKWGNSAAVRVPAGALADSGLHIGQVLNIRAEAGRLVLEPASESLEALLARMTPENCQPSAWEEDRPLGVEIW